MKLLSAWPRQPFLGLALSAMTGIIVADSWPNTSPTLAAVVVAGAVAAWVSRSLYFLGGSEQLHFVAELDRIPPAREKLYAAGTTFRFDLDRFRLQQK